MKSENVTIKKEYCPNCFNAIGSMRPCPYCGNEQFDRKNPLAAPGKCRFKESICCWENAWRWWIRNYL